MSQIAHNLGEKERTKDILISENYNFNALLLSKETSQGLKAAGFYKPSPIQLKAIPLGRCGLDLIVKAKSGTGKTAVFTIIALEMINISKNALQVLIFAPTREIAVQIQDVIKTIGNEKKGLEVALFIGGLPLENDIENAKRCHVAVGAPGRLKHLAEKGYLNLKTVRLLIFDEADKLMQDSFQSDINCIYYKLPERKQVIALSATYTDELKIFLERYMQSPTFVTPEDDNSMLLGLRQFVTVVDACGNVVLQMKSKTEELIRLLSKIIFTQCLVFCNYQQRAESISNMLNNKGWSSMYISGAQTQVERLKAFDSLKKFKCRILLSTDLTARGIDACNVDLVINYDVPNEAATYLHRMGRAGRYGARGLCITISSDGKELKILQGILGEIGGAEFSIAKLPGGEKLIEDPWECDMNCYDKVFGVVNTDVNKDLLKTSVLEVKNKRKHKNETDSVSSDLKQLSVDENKSHVQKADQLELENIKNMTDSNQKIQEISKKYEDIDSESLLQSLAAGASFKIEDKQENINKNEALNSVLESLAAGASFKIEDKQENINKNEALNSVLESLAAGASFKIQDEQENINKNEALNSVLEMLASGGNITEEDTENQAEDMINPALMYPWVPVDVPVLLKPNTGISLLESSNSQEEFVTNKDNKKRKRKPKPNSNSPEVASNIDQLKQNFVLHKNIALFNVSKLLTNTNLEEDVAHVLEPIGNYLKLIEENNQNTYNQMDKFFENYSNDDLLKNIAEHMEQWSEACKTKELGELLDPEENIFKIAYEMHLKNGIDWTIVLGNKYVEESEAEDDMETEDIEEDYEEDVTYSPKSDNYTTGESDANFAANGRHQNRSARATNEMQSINPIRAAEEANSNSMSVDSGYSGQVTNYSNVDQQNTFVSYFDHCSQMIRNNALTFEDVPSFDNWFEQWQRQVDSVRDFAQENLYVQEMSNYQYNNGAYSYYPYDHNHKLN